ncbi:MAG: SRPBCC family protein [Acidimicrobiia bacterium]
MEYVASLTTPASVAAVEPFVASLDRYPSWLGIINSVKALDPDDGRPAWAVELRARLGPLARSKRLRMLCTIDEAGPRDTRRWVFERAEVDGRPHSAWVLEATLSSSGSAAAKAKQPKLTRLEMQLRYDGSMWGPVLERLLRDEVDKSIPRLRQLVEA